MILSKKEVGIIILDVFSIPDVLGNEDLYIFADAIERAVLAKVSQQWHGDPTIGNYINSDDVNSLVRRLDVAINGENAAEQASLCDIVAQVEAMPAHKQEPIYMWRLHGEEGWMECTKEWFDADISSGYEKRIVYAHPSPPQAAPKLEPKPMIDFDYMKNKDSKPEKINDGDLEFFVYPDPKPEITCEVVKADCLSTIVSRSRRYGHPWVKDTESKS